MLKYKSIFTWRFKSSIIDLNLYIFLYMFINFFSNFSFKCVDSTSPITTSLDLYFSWTLSFFWALSISNFSIFFFNSFSTSCLSFSIFFFSSLCVFISFIFSWYSFNCKFIFVSISFLSLLYFNSKLCFNDSYSSFFFFSFSSSSIFFCFSISCWNSVWAHSQSISYISFPSLFSIYIIIVLVPKIILSLFFKACPSWLFNFLPLI